MKFHEGLRLVLLIAVAALVVVTLVTVRGVATKVEELPAEIVQLRTICQTVDHERERHHR